MELKGSCRNDEEFFSVENRLLVNLTSLQQATGHMLVSPGSAVSRSRRWTQEYRQVSSNTSSIAVSGKALKKIN